jgi:hypothetical protein
MTCRAAAGGASDDDGLVPVDRSRLIELGLGEPTELLDWAE